MESMVIEKVPVARSPVILVPEKVPESVPWKTLAGVVEVEVSCTVVMAVFVVVEITVVVAVVVAVFVVVAVIVTGGAWVVDVTVTLSGVTVTVAAEQPLKSTIMRKAVIISEDILVIGNLSKILISGNGFLHLERETGFEPATFCLGSRHSTTELLPLAG